MVFHFFVSLLLPNNSDIVNTETEKPVADQNDCYVYLRCALCGSREWNRLVSGLSLNHGDRETDTFEYFPSEIRPPSVFEREWCFL